MDASAVGTLLICNPNKVYQLRNAGFIHSIINGVLSKINLILVNCESFLNLQEDLEMQLALIKSSNIKNKQNNEFYVEQLLMHISLPQNLLVPSEDILNKASLRMRRRIDLAAALLVA